MNPKDLSYLAQGTASQRSAFRSLSKLQLLEALAEYDATLVSTVCLDIDIPSSDLDIICEAHNMNAFVARISVLYGQLPEFIVRPSESDSSALIVVFRYDEWEYEIFAQPVPIEKQNAYRHMVQIHRVIILGGQRWRDAICTLKLQGLKTEPSLARCLRLKGDPYRAVLDLEALSDAKLLDLMKNGPILHAEHEGN